MAAAGTWVVFAALAAGTPSPGPSPSPSPQAVPTEHVRSFSAADLQGAPRPADAWSVLRDVPGLVLDRVDVGGSGTAIQPVVVGRGDPGTGVGWWLDGFDVGDPAAPGAASLFLDTGLLAEMTVTTHATNPRVRAGGPQVFLAFPAPAAQWTAGAQAALAAPVGEGRPDALAGRSLFRDDLRHASELRADAGGPLRGDRLSLWLGASRNAQERDTSDGHADALAATTFVTRARARAGGGTIDLLALRSEKVHDRRAPVRGAAREALWRQSGPAHLVGLTVSRGAWTARGAWLDSGFSLRAPGDGPVWEDASGVVHGGYSRFETDRPRWQAGLSAAPRVRALGRPHQLSLGVHWKRSTLRTETSWPASQVLGFERDTVFFRAFDISGFALPTRAQHARVRHEHLEAYVQDDVTLGAFRVVGALRLERVSGRGLPTAVGANPEFPALLPAAATDGGSGRIRWTDVLPRVALAWTPRASTSAEIGYAAYAAPLGAGELTFAHPLGRETASLTYYWLDLDADHQVDAGELDLVRGRLGASGVDADAPGQPRSPHLVDPALAAPRTHAVTGVVRHARGSLHAAVHASWRRSTDVLWRPLRDLTLADYRIEGAVRGMLFGDSFEVGYYAPANASRIVPGNGRLLANRPGYVQDWWTAELDLDGRLRGARWNAWAAVHDWREWFSGTAGIQDPTPTESEPLRDGGVIAVRAGGLGRDVFVNARWTAGASVHVPLPLRLRLDARLHAREGFPVPYIQVASTSDPTGGGKNVLVASRLDAYRLPAVVMVDARLAREVGLGRGRATLALDVCNVLGRTPTLQLARDVELPSLSRPRDIAPGRVLRVALGWRM